MTQLALELDAVAPASAGDFEPLGDLVDRELLAVLRRALPGWEIPDPRSAFAGEGVLVLARRGPFEVGRVGGSLSDVVAEIVAEAQALHGAAG